MIRESLEMKKYKLAKMRNFKNSNKNKGESESGQYSLIGDR